jgi:hypothetical protein
VTAYEPCGYTHDISGAGRGADVFGHLDGAEWSCQHPSETGSEYCLFHQPVQEKDDQEVVDRFQQVVNTGYDDVTLPPQERVRFIGATFGRFSLPLFSTVATTGDFTATATGAPIDLRDVRVEGDLHWSNVTVRHDVLFDGASVAGTVEFSETTIDGHCSFSHGEFASFVRLDAAEIRGRLRFERAECDGAVSLRAAEIDGRVRFAETHVGGSTGNGALDEQPVAPGDVVCEGAAFDHHVHFENAVLEGAADFKAATVGGGVHFEGATVDGTTERDGISGSVLFYMADIEFKAEFRETTIDGRVTFRKATIGDSVSFKGACIGGSANLIEASTGDFVSFSSGNVEGKIRLKNAVVEDKVSLRRVCSERAVELQDAAVGGDVDFREGTVDARVKLDRATVDGDAKFGDADISRATFDGAHISGDAHVDGPFDDPPSLNDITVDGVLSLGFSVPDSDRPVIELQEATLGAIRPSRNTWNQVLRLDGSTIGRLTVSEIPDDRFLTRWSLQRMRFEEFDFTVSRSLLEKRDWNLHELDADARDALARVRARRKAREDAFALVGMLFNAPTVAERIDDGDIDPANLDAIISGAADAADAEQSVTFRDGSDQDFVDAVASERVSTLLETIAANYVSARATDDVLTPESDQLLKDDLQAALADAYTDPEQFRARNNPNVWEATYLDAKQAASDQGLNDVAAEFFVREKRFKRRGHARQVRAGESLFGRVTALFDWAANLTMDVTTGYGERPRNIVLTSLGTVALFTGIYRALDALPSGSGVPAYLLFSLQNFVTFIIGTRPEGTLVVRYASALEAFLGAFFIALFVFTLTRSLNR